MDFHQLLAKMQQLDQPVPEQTTNEMGCGDPMTPPPLSAVPPKPDTPPPSMSINLNAQGMDNIEQLMKLVTKVNPEMEKPSLPPMPSLSAPPSIMSIKPSMPPLKMLPDMDADNDDMPGGEKDHMEPDGDEGPEPKMPSDNDGDEEDKDKKSEWANSPAGSESEPELKGSPFDATGDDLHKEKKGFRAAAGGDNPMKIESGDLRSQIRAELQRRLNEAKGVK